MTNVAAVVEYRQKKLETYLQVCFTQLASFYLKMVTL